MQQAWNDLTATISKNKVKSLILTNSNFALSEYIADFIKSYFLLNSTRKKQQKSFLVVIRHDHYLN